MEEEGRTERNAWKPVVKLAIVSQPKRKACGNQRDEDDRASHVTLLERIQIVVLQSPISHTDEPATTRTRGDSTPATAE